MKSLHYLMILTMTAVTTAHAQTVLFDAAQNGSFTSISAGTYHASLDGAFSVNAANTNRMMIVAVNWEENFSGSYNGAQVTGISWGTQSLNLLVDQVSAGSGGNHVSLWYLANPDGGSQTLSIVTDGAFGGIYTATGASAGDAFLSVFSLADADTSAPLFDSRGFNGSTNTSLSFTGVASGSFAIDTVGFNNPGSTDTLAFSATEQLNINQYGGGMLGGSSYLDNASGNITFTDTASYSTRGAQAALVVAAIPEPTTGILLVVGAVFLFYIGCRRQRKHGTIV